MISIKNSTNQMEKIHSSSERSNALMEMIINLPMDKRMFRHCPLRLGFVLCMYRFPCPTISMVKSTDHRLVRPLVVDFAFRSCFVRCLTSRFPDVVDQPLCTEAQSICQSMQISSNRMTKRAPFSVHLKQS